MNPAIAVPADYGHDARYLRPEARRPVPRRGVRRGWRRLARLATRAVLIGGLTGAAAAGLRGLASSGAFAVSDIQVAGCRHARPEAIRALLTPMAGRNILDVDLREAAHLAAGNPWVADAEIRRRLPGTLSVTIREREPAGVALIDGHATLVDAAGIALADCGAVAVSCTSAVITGLDGLADPVRASRIAGGVAALSEVRRLHPALAGRVSEISVAEDRISLLPDDGGAPILLSPVDYGRNVENFASVEDEIRQRWQRLDYVDLRFRGRIGVMPASAAASEDHADAPAPRKRR